MLGEILGAIGGFLGLGQQAKANADAKDLALHSVQYRVKDAQEAGIHPLAALGAPTLSMSPVSVGDVGAPFRDLGQGLDRAYEAGNTLKGRAGDLALQLTQAQVDGAYLDNDIKRVELASRVRRSLVGAGVPPVIPDPGANTARGADIGGQTIPLPGGKTITTGQTGTSEEIERQYGDVVQNIYGIGRMVDDTANNVAPGFDWNRLRFERVAPYLLHELFGINPAH